MNKKIQGKMDALTLQSTQDALAYQNKIDTLTQLVPVHAAEIAALRNDIAMLQQNTFSEKIEQVTASASTDKERVLRVASWIATTFVNADTISDTFASFALRTGLCRNRADIFVKAMKHLLIPAHVFNLYNFPRPGEGHSAAVAWYGGKWHYFDLMYGGYFEKEGVVMSWEEIIADPNTALASLKPFPSTHDKWYKQGGNITYPASMPRQQFLTEIPNSKRLAHYYTKEHLAQAVGASGVMLDSNYIKALRIQEFDASLLPIAIGTRDQDYTDVDNYGSTHKLTEYLAFSLSTHIDFFTLDWTFTGVTPGQEYMLCFFLYGDSPASFSARAFEASVHDGATYTHDRGNSEWQIRFTPDTSTVRFTFSAETKKQYSGPLIDAIQLGTR